jgi:hypothetical protein
MIELENFSNHLSTLKSRDWERLFELIPQIETTEIFGQIKGSERLDDGSLTLPYWNSSEIVNKTFNIIGELNISPLFDWTIWKEGKFILNDKDLDYAKLDTITLCKLLTTIIRIDRFNDGFLISCFERGVITKIIKGIKSNINFNYLRE